VDSTADGQQAVDLGRKPRRRPKVREASFEDYDQIAVLESRHGLREKSYEQWSHLWLGNPLYRELPTRWSIGWVLEDESGQIVGSLGNIPLWYEFEGRRVVVGASRFWVAEPEYRSASLLLVNELVHQPQMDLYLTNTFSAASSAALGVFSFQQVPVGLWNEAAFWITNYQGFLESFLTLKHYPLAKSLSYPFSAAVFLKDRLTNKALRAGDVEVKACAGFDERFDDFWVESKSRSPHVLWAVRTREMLEWHYKYALLNNRVWIATVVDGPHLVAYAVFDRKDKGSIGLKRVRLVDFQSLEGGTALLPPLIAWALRRCASEGIHVLENSGRWLEKGEVLDTLAPYRRRMPNWRFVYRANDPELAESLRDRRVWAPSLYDSDASLGW
jgi:hypothetical protein